MLQNNEIHKIVNRAVHILNNGGIIIYPTDTAFGIGCRIDNIQAIERLFQIRERPLEKAVPVLVSSIKMAQNFLFPISSKVKLLMENYWPGGLTVIYNCIEDKVPSLVRGGKKSLGIRMPNHKIPLSIIEKIQVPLLGPSANFHKNNTPFNYNDLDKELIKLVDLVINGECELKSPSTVIDCTIYPFKVIREGAVAVDKKYLI